MDKDLPLLKHAKLRRMVSRMRWLIPPAVALLGVLYVSPNPFQAEPSNPIGLLQTILFPLLVAPGISWILLTWVDRAVQAAMSEQQEIVIRDRELVALNAIGETSTKSLELQTVLLLGLEKIGELTGIDVGEVRLTESDRLIAKAHMGISPKKQSETEVRVGECLCGRCAKLGEVIAIHDLPSDPSRTGILCAQEGFRSLIALPMKTDRQIHGVILLASKNVGAFGPVDERILTAVASRMAMAVENARLYQQSHTRILHLETASHLGQRVASHLDVESLLPEVVNLIREAYGYYHTHILLVDEKAGELVLKEASGPNAEAMKSRGLRLRIGQEGITGWVAQAGESILCNDVSREPRYLPAELVPRTRSELAVPLRAGNRVIGVLDVQSDQIDAFQKEDLIVMQVLGNQLGIAIDNARLFQETKYRYETMSALHETSLDMVARLDTTQLLEALLRRGAQLLGGKAGALFLCDARGQSIHNVASYNTWRDWTGATLRLGEGIVGKVIQQGEPMIVNDYETWTGRSPVSAGTMLTRVIGVPLRSESRIVGALSILNDSESRPFEENDIWLLGQFADLASIAIRNAELHSQIKQFSQELERKVESRTHELSKAKEEIAARSEQLHRLLTQTMRIQEDERSRIARDMHDDVVQLISAARLELDAAEISGRPDLKPSSREKLLAARELLDEMEKQIRRAIYDLHPPSLDAVGLDIALKNYANRFGGISGIDCRVEIKGRVIRLPFRSQSSIFRMVEEALSNVASHAEARQASVQLDYQEEELFVVVQDDGKGFDKHTWEQDSGRDGSHLGLLGMQERAQSLGGSMRVESAHECGTRVTFRIPIGRGEAEWNLSES